jgi:hypothetical protein
LASSRSRTEIVSQILDAVYDHDGDDDGEGIRKKGPQEERQEDVDRWAKLMHIPGKNIQQWDNTPPNYEEGFLRMTIIDGSPNRTKSFVVGETLGMVLARKWKSAEYFTTTEEGRKIGVSIEWKQRDDVWRNTSDEELQLIRRWTGKIRVEKEGGTIEA